VLGHVGIEHEALRRFLFVLRRWTVGLVRRLRLLLFAAPRRLVAAVVAGVGVDSLVCFLLGS
jgi:hypothetical protein